VEHQSLVRQAEVIKLECRSALMKMRACLHNGIHAGGIAKNIAFAGLESLRAALK